MQENAALVEGSAVAAIALQEAAAHLDRLVSTLLAGGAETTPSAADRGAALPVSPQYRMVLKRQVT